MERLVTVLTRRLRVGVLCRVPGLCYKWISLSRTVLLLGLRRQILGICCLRILVAHKVRQTILFWSFVPPLTLSLEAYGTYYTLDFTDKCLEGTYGGALQLTVRCKDEYVAQQPSHRVSHGSEVDEEQAPRRIWKVASRTGAVQPCSMGTLR